MTKQARKGNISNVSTDNVEWVNPPPGAEGEGTNPSPATEHPGGSSRPVEQDATPEEKEDEVLSQPDGSVGDEFAYWDEPQSNDDARVENGMKFVAKKEDLRLKQQEE